MDMDFKLGLPIRAFWGFMSPFVRIWMKLLMNPTIENTLPADLKPPYLMISNHVTVYDGLLVVLNSKHLPVLVFDDVQSTDPFKKLLFTEVGVIFKPSGMADALTIRKMVRAKDAGRSLLLYPEGEITWDGDSKPLEMNFARLVRLLRVPVVLAKLKGGYTKQPNWSNVTRKGGCKLEYSLIATPEQVKSMNDEELLDHLRKAHSHKEIDWLASQEGKGFIYSTPAPSKGLEHLLFCCPSCGGYNCMTTFDPEAISCSNCGYTAGVSQRLSLFQKDSPLVYDDIRKWYSWQKQHWTAEVASRLAKGGAILTAECPLITSTPIAGGKTRHIGHGPAVLDADGITYVLNDRTNGRVGIDEIKVSHCIKFSANKDYRLMIRTEDQFLVFQLTEPNLPVLSWEQAIKYIQHGRRREKQG